MELCVVGAHDDEIADINTDDQPLLSLPVGVQVCSFSLRQGGLSMSVEHVVEAQHLVGPELVDEVGQLSNIHFLLVVAVEERRFDVHALFMNGYVSHVII